MYMTVRNVFASVRNELVLVMFIICMIPTLGIGIKAIDKVAQNCTITILKNSHYIELL